MTYFAGKSWWQHCHDQEKAEGFWRIKSSCSEILYGEGKALQGIFGWVLNSSPIIHAFNHVFNLFFPSWENPLFELIVYKFMSSLTKKKLLQIKAVGTVDEIYKQVYPVFASLNFEVFRFCFHFQFCFPRKYFVYDWLACSF